MFFLYFDIFLKENVNIDSLRLINDFKMNTLQIKCVESKFLNFTSFEKSFKMQKWRKYIKIYF